MDGPSRRIAAVHLHQLPLDHVFHDLAPRDAKGRKDRERMCAVRADIRGRAVIIDVSERTRRDGIVPGMTVTEARARCPELEIRERDPSGELKRLRAAAELCFAYGPHVEVAPPSIVFADVGAQENETKLAEELIRTMKKAGHAVTVAIAKDPDTARTFAAHAAHELRLRARSKKKNAAEPPPPMVIVPPGQEITMLDRLPIDALTWTDTLEDPEGNKRERLRAIQASLRVLGINDIAGLRALPADQVASRFGDAGALLMSRAAAELDRPLRRFTPPDQLVEEHELDGPLEELEPVLFVLKRMFDRIEARLDARTLSAGSVLLGFDVEPDLERTVASDSARRASSREKVEVAITLARPSRRASTMLALAREKLGGALPGAVRALSVEARSTAIDRGAQLDLFSTYAKKLEDVSELVGRLVAAFGEQAVFSPEVADTHRPEAAWRAKPFEIERALEAFRVEKKEAPKPAPVEKPMLEREVPRSSYVLPAVDDGLRVATVPEHTVESVLAELEGRKKAWPKAIQRKVEDEPLPALPPRPMELFETPERATYLPKNDQATAGVLVWRGSRLPIATLGGCERIEAEWWSGSPITREYAVAEVGDGRKLWIFFEAEGDTFVHGIFD